MLAGRERERQCERGGDGGRENKGEMKGERLIVSKLDGSTRKPNQHLYLKCIDQGYGI